MKSNATMNEVLYKGSINKLAQDTAATRVVPLLPTPPLGAAAPSPLAPAPLPNRTHNALTQNADASLTQVAHNLSLCRWATR